MFQVYGSWGEWIGAFFKNFKVSHIIVVGGLYLALWLLLKFVLNYHLSFKIYLILGIPIYLVGLFLYVTICKPLNSKPPDK